jgi:hypothetical protein
VGADGGVRRLRCLYARDAVGSDEASESRQMPCGPKMIHGREPQSVRVTTRAVVDERAYVCTRAGSLFGSPRIVVWRMASGWPGSGAECHGDRGYEACGMRCFWRCIHVTRTATVEGSVQLLRKDVVRDFAAWIHRLFLASTGSGSLVKRSPNKVRCVHLHEVDFEDLPSECSPMLASNCCSLPTFRRLRVHVSL